MSRISSAVFSFALCTGLAAHANAKAFTDYFKPAPSVCPPTSNTWGDKAVIPRDTCNGLEDTTGTPTVRPKWMYWDGKILRAKDGKYHMFADRWAHANGMGAWVNSETIHATSPALMGPYTDQGFAFNDGPDTSSPHKGHNVTAAELPDGTYCLIVNEIVPFTIFTATSLDGPWKNQGHAQIDTNGVPLSIPFPGDQHLESNVSFVVRPDGNYEIIQRHGIIAVSTTGLLGPYKVQKPTTTYPAAQQPPSSLATVFPNRPTHLSPLAPKSPESVYVYAEDPIIWYSGGQYHVIYNYPDDRVAYHLTSPDGVHGWTDQGLAFDPRDGQKIFANSDGSATTWFNVERPNVIMENGHVAYFTFAVSDVFKMGISGNSNNNTKVVVVPFDGVAFDNDTGIGGPDGGVPGTGGAGGAGGTSGTGGGTGSGGNAGSGGRDAASDSDGSAGSGAGGKTTSAGGAGGTNVGGASGGATGSGGASGGTGGRQSDTGSGGNSRGGSSGSSGGSQSGGSAGRSGVAGGDNSGCSCELAGRRGQTDLGLGMGAFASLGAVAFLRRRRHQRRAPHSRP